MKNLHDKLNESTCAKCGKCLSVCPVYNIDCREQNSPRGKIALLEISPETDLLKSKYLEEIINTCLLCGACANACPSGVMTDDIIWRGRREIADVRGIPLSKRAASKYLLQNKWLLPTVMKSGSLMKGLISRRVPETSGLHRRFALPFLNRKRYIPMMNSEFFVSSRVKEFITPNAKMKVALFVGCVINYLFPHMGHALTEVLLKAGASVIIPPGQQCCGLPAYGFGDMDSVLELARRRTHYSS